MNHVLLHDATRMRQQEQRMDEVIATPSPGWKGNTPAGPGRGARVSDQFVQRQQEYSKDTPPPARAVP
ncbi:hypothetical protein ACPA9J_14185 [Pseudomonas aeruginosa]